MAGASAHTAAPSNKIDLFITTSPDSFTAALILPRDANVMTLRAVAELA
jgi:hypothetical protein